MEYVMLEPVMMQGPKLSRVSWFARHVYVELILLSGRHDLQGVFTPQYVDPEWLHGAIGMDTREASPSEVGAALTDLVDAGLLERQGSGVLVIPAWAEMYGRRKRKAKPAEAEFMEVPENTGSSPEPGQTNKHTLHTEQDETGLSPPLLAVLWNKMLGDKLPRVKKLAGQRLIQARARCKEWKEAEVVEALERIRKIPGLLGENDRGWKASFDWFVTPLALPKILEGKYDHWGTGQSPVKVEELTDTKGLYDGDE